MIGCHFDKRVGNLEADAGDHLRLDRTKAEDVYRNVCGKGGHGDSNGLPDSDIAEPLRGGTDCGEEGGGQYLVSAHSRLLRAPYAV